MARFFISHKWRIPKFVWFLMIFEAPFTVANLALFGVASPDLYRTILWSEGGKMGFNSDPSTIVYAYANYRPVSIPLIWSQFATQYNLVIGVLCMFFYLVKFAMWILHFLFPILSLILHLALCSLWSYSIYIQTSPDTIDPARENHGAPWYLTKSCNIVSDHNVRNYCRQAKSAFAVSIIMMATYAVFAAVSLYSIFPTAEQKKKRGSKLGEKKAQKEKWVNTGSYDNENEPITVEQQWQHMWELQQLPRTPRTSGTAGGINIRSPMTPRTVAFNNLAGGEAGQSKFSRAWQGKYGGNGGLGMAVNPVSEDEYAHEHEERFGTGSEKSHTGMAM